MASHLLTRGLHSLVSAQASRPDEFISWDAIIKRDSETEQTGVMGVVWVITNVLIFLPVLLFLSYTINILYPTLAILEATDSPPEYELILTKENEDEADGKISSGSNSDGKNFETNSFLDRSSSPSTPLADETGGAPSIRPQPVTSGVLKTLLLLRATGGGLFKSFKWQFISICVHIPFFVAFSFIPHFPDVITSIIASLAATKVETVWTHVAVSKERISSPWKKSPGYFSILKATAIPLVLQAILIEVVATVSVLPLGPVTGTHNGAPIRAHIDSFLNVSASLSLALALYACISLPTEVVLTRTRAAMLPEDTSTIVVLDLSIRSQLVEGMGFLSWVQIWRSFSRASWLRLLKIWVKIFAITIVAQILVVSLFFAQSLIYTAAVEG